MAFTHPQMVPKIIWRSCSTAEKRELVRQLKEAHLGRDNFTSLLMHLMQKADAENSHKLAEAYPREYAVVWAWKNELIKPDYTLAEEDESA